MSIYNMPFPQKTTPIEYFHINIVKLPCVANLPHTHDYFQIYYVINSSLVHHIDGQSSSLSRGDMFIVPPNKMHYVDLQEDSEFYCISFYPDFLEKSVLPNDIGVLFLQKLQSDAAENIRPKLTIDPTDIYYIEITMAHILKEYTEKSFGYEDIVKKYISLLVSMFARNYFKEEYNALPTTIENNKQYMLLCVEYIEQNYTEDITLEEVCKRSAMSKSNFCALFMEITGYSFNTYLNMCRIEKSKEYIKQNYNISVLYGLCGYNNFSTFHRNFKKIMGITPREYKKIQQSKKSNTYSKKGTD